MGRYTWEEAKELHYKLWDEIYKKGLNAKWKTDTGKEHPVVNECYCCDVAGIGEWLRESYYVRGKAPCIKRADNCPIKWITRRAKGNKAPCECEGSLFYRWDRLLSSDKERLKELAAQIRDLPWRKKRGRR
jgi:hypothetical protein